MNFGQVESLPAGATAARGGRQTLLERFNTERRAQIEVDNTFSMNNALHDAYDARAQLLLKETGADLRLMPGPFGYRRSAIGGGTLAMRATFRDYERWFEREYEKAVGFDPDLREKIPDGKKMRDTIFARMRDIEAASIDSTSRADGLGSAASAFVGRVVGSFADPLTIASAPLGGPGKSVLGTAGRGVLAAGATEAVLQPAVQKNRSDAGLEAGFTQGLANVGVSAVAGGVLSGGGHALRKAPSAINRGYDAALLKVDRGRWAARQLDQIMKDAPGFKPRAPMTREDMVAAFDGAVPDPTPAQSHMRHVVEQDAKLDGAAPVAPSPRAKAEFRASVAAAGRGDDFEVPVPQLGATAPEVRLSDGYDTYAPDELIVDADTFQFKAGGDAKGVTDRLQGVTKWDPIKAGPLLVWESKSGQKFVADGHQRSGLARRLSEADPKAKISLRATTLREADGISAADARAMAAAANLANGSGSAVDAAKVLRVSPDLLDGSIPLTGTKMKMALGLKNLTDDALMLVVNEVVPDRFAAIVGRMAGDKPEIQLDLMKLLTEAKPENLFQAESMIQQALAAPVRRETQDSLFGAEEIVQSLFRERARVLDAAVKRLRKNQTVFRTLLNEEKRITKGGGNRLDRSANEQKVQTDAEIETIITRLANRVGPISQALDDAARALADGKPLAGVAREFADTVTAQAGKNGEAGGGVRGAGGGARAGDADPRLANEGRPQAIDAPAPQILDDFSDPDVAARNQQADDLERELSARELDDKTTDMFGDPGLPVGQVIDEGGISRAATVTREEADKIIADDVSLLDRLRGCAYE